MKIGLIGAGNMASALLSGMLKNLVQPGDVMISDRDEEKLAFWKKQGISVTTNNGVVEDACDIIILAVKPKIIPYVLQELSGKEDKIYISIAAGITVAFLENALGKDKKIVRTMPNTPAQVGCGMTVLVPNKNITEQERKTVFSLFDSVGDTLQLSESELEIATAIHGSSPAYVYMMMDALADAGVRHGLTKENALKLAAKAVEGSAKMVLETGTHPEQLKDNVCSPGGTTIAAVRELERTGFRASLHAAVDACIKRNQEMKK